MTRPLRHGAASAARQLSRQLFAVALAVCMAAIGVVAGLYWRFEASKTRAMRYSTEDAAHAFRLNRRLAAQERRNQSLAQDIQLLTYQMDRRLSQSYRASQRRKLDRLADYTGLRTRQGVGVEIVLRDSDRPYRLEENPNVGIIHNVDMLAVVNQLWAAGATAVAINGQRIVASSEIHCAGPVLLVNQSRIAPPFVIQAMGSVAPNKGFLDAINREGRALKQLSAYGIEIAMRVKPMRILPFVPTRRINEVAASPTRVGP